MRSFVRCHQISLKRGMLIQRSYGSSLPIIDLSRQQTRRDHDSKQEGDLSKQVYDAFSTWGAFVVVGSNISAVQQRNTLEQARSFFNLPLSEKEKLHVKNGGIAWRGWMPFGGENTHGKLDEKEGLYLGPEHLESDPHMGTPLYGKNLFPDEVLPKFRQTSLDYITEVEKLGHRLMELTSLGLGLDDQFIRKNYTYDSLSIVRMFSYPYSSSSSLVPTVESNGKWGIGEHSDYGLLTMLTTDSPGLEFYNAKQKIWVNAPVIPGAIICNCGDILDRMTNGRFISPMHRAKNVNSDTLASRISIPFFFDPSWNAQMKILPLHHLSPLTEQENQDAQKRWDNTTIVKFEGEYSSFLAKKVSKIFSDVIPESAAANLTSTKGPSSRFAIKIPVK